MSRHSGIPCLSQMYTSMLGIEMFCLRQEIFDIGFVTELPSSDPGSVKVQFLHKSLQEYLAAFYVVSCPNEKGLQLLMEFCSLSQRLMGSQIILNFISAMSQKLRKLFRIRSKSMFLHGLQMMKLTRKVEHPF